MNQISESVVRDAAPGLEATTGTERDQIEQGLVRDAKAYLDERAQGMTPSFLLSEAWDHFFAYGSSVIRGRLRARGLSREDHDDCEQEFWVAVVTQLRRSGYESARAGLRTWLSAIARNKSADVIRRRIRPHPLTLNETATTQIPGREADPASVYERKEEKDLMHKALAALSQLVADRSYQVLLLRSIEELDVSEVAAALGLTLDQVRYRDCRAKQELRRLVETSER
jgi:RNA polymerase sigma factor (sigma-70 family)